MMGKFKVAEKFVSINGESKKAGELACFIRFAGCNLNCSYCDTRWANEENVPYEVMSEEEIYTYIKRMGVFNVTLTGGEPLVQENIGALIELLLTDEELCIEIETNGAVPIEPFCFGHGNLSFTVDYKLPDSGMEDRMCHDNFLRVSENDAVKFVASSERDLDRAREIIEQYNLTDRTMVYISTCFGALKPETVVDYMIKNNMNKVKLQLQMHKYIWEPERRGV